MWMGEPIAENGRWGAETQPIIAKLPKLRRAPCGTEVGLICSISPLTRCLFLSLPPYLLISFSPSLPLAFSHSLLVSFSLLFFSHLFSTFLLLSFSPFLSLSLSHFLIRSRWVCEVKEFTISQRRVLDSKAVCGWVVSDSANYRLSWAWPRGRLRKGMHHDTASYCIHLQRYCIYIYCIILYIIWSKEV